MTDWNDYATTSHKTSQGGGEAPKIGDYVVIKLIENWVAVCVVFFVVGGAIGGLICSSSEHPAMIEASKWFFESAKVCMGVFLGLMTSKK